MPYYRCTEQFDIDYIYDPASLFDIDILYINGIGIEKRIPSPLRNREAGSIL